MSSSRIRKIRLIQILYEGLDYSNKTMIESLCNGTFTSKTADDACQFFEEVAENTLEWEPVIVDNKKLTTTTAINWDSGIHKVSPNFESDAKLTSVVRRFEALELSKGAQSLAPEPSKPVVSPIYVFCDSQDHLVE